MIRRAGRPWPVLFGMTLAAVAGCGGDEFSTAEQTLPEVPAQDSAVEATQQESSGPDGAEPEALPESDGGAEEDDSSDGSETEDVETSSDALVEADSPIAEDAALDAAVVQDAAFEADATLIVDAAAEADAALVVDAGIDVAIICSSPAVLCGTMCVDLKTSLSNCGSCGNICPSGTTCTGGSCSCPGNQTFCNGVCVDTTTSDTNCGACGVTCIGAKHCAAGKCM